ncbi:MAG: 50S ribosomal protein L21 [Boseongicola sp. SB0664_bin_43]|uniref:Large ribosomal subunit protein bL21 n=1 Tax=Boseongicola sp. SB0664_bin_43 TaxID=2604844 RepID=A0A6B0XXH2_9RHOB|nr:50S ribosomal protein L21 [Boseongicola sp. SB0664_bin_43]MYK32794.1 50S ribosomal protein L21 [Boseongicola sp. SB0670_bin_30]
MFAVLKTGGKQYRVKAGDMLRVEKLAAGAGDVIQFNEVLMVGTSVGTPLVDGAAVQAEVVDQIKGEKVINFVRRRRKSSSKRTKGHRQQLTLVRVTNILETGAGQSGVKPAVGARSAAAVAAKPTKPARKSKDQAGKKQAATKPEPEAEAVPKAKGRDASVAATQKDDLKKLAGVGPALEKKLNAAGITTYAQIAAWSADEVAKINEELALKGRIERDGWVDQAKALTSGEE